MTDRHIIIFRDENGADETVFFGTLEEARRECARLEAEGEVISAILEQDL